MPILKHESDLFPEHLFDLPIDVSPWWVAHLKSRQEKVASRESRLRGIPSFLPQYEKSVRKDGRTRTAFLPLFSGYLFFRGGFDERAEMLMTNLCVRILEVKDQDSLDFDLRQIHRLQLSGVPIVSHPDTGLKPGDTVRIKDGPFRDISCVIVKKRRETHLIVAVRFINRFVSVEVPRESVVKEQPRWVHAPAERANS